VFFLFYIGCDRDSKYWLKRAKLHASWLNLTIGIKKWCINSQKNVFFASINSNSDSDSQLSKNTMNSCCGVAVKEKEGIWTLKYLLTEENYNRALTSFDWRTMWIVLSADGQNICLWRGLTSVGQIYYCCKKDSIVFSNDFRLLMPKNTCNLDPAGFYSIFQFGAVSAPYTLFKNIKCVPSGHLVRFDGQTLREQCIPNEIAALHESTSISTSPEDIMEEAIKNEINKIPTNSALLFSGGVDSGLLAALAKRQGRCDIQLINCDFTPIFGSGFTDPEAKLARDMAAHLGYNIAVFPFEYSLVPKMLCNIGKDYTFPFGDYSTLPTNLVADYATSLLNVRSWVVDGTGSDGIFMGTQYWKRTNRIYQIPVLIRKLLALLYRFETIFYSPNRLSRLLGAFNQSLQIPPLQFHVIAQNRLGGIAFLADKKTLEDVICAQKNYLQAVFKGFEDRGQISWVDLIHICVGIFAAKDYDPIRSRGMIPYFPFLSEGCITSGHKLMVSPCESKENKGILKSLLLRDVPSEMIYRPKSGFSPPIEKIFRDNTVNEYINDIVFEANNPLNDFVYPHVMHNLFNAIINGKHLYNKHLNLLWSYIFTSIWFDHQLKSYPEPLGT